MADRVHGGALPVPVNCIMDEFPNVSLPNEFEKILATCRSRSIYCSIIIQNMSQLKALFKDSWESLVGNCDEFLYLGGNEKETHKYVSELLGKETIDTNTYGQTKGKSGSYSTNFQRAEGSCYSRMKSVCWITRMHFCLSAGSGPYWMPSMT